MAPTFIILSLKTETFAPWNLDEFGWTLGLPNLHFVWLAQVRHHHRGFHGLRCCPAAVRRNLSSAATATHGEDRCVGRELRIGIPQFEALSVDSVLGWKGLDHDLNVIWKWLSHGWSVGDQPHLFAVAAWLSATKCPSAAAHVSLCASLPNSSANLHVRHWTKYDEVAFFIFWFDT